MPAKKHNLDKPVKLQWLKTTSQEEQKSIHWDVKGKWFIGLCKPGFRLRFFLTEHSLSLRFLKKAIDFVNNLFTNSIHHVKGSTALPIFGN